MIAESYKYLRSEQIWSIMFGLLSSIAFTTAWLSMKKNEYTAINDTLKKCKSLPHKQTRDENEVPPDP